MYILKQIWKGYRVLFVDYSDPRSNHWWLVSTPYPSVTLIAVYVWFSLRIGPYLMAKRKPFELKTAKTIYNAAQIVSNAALVIYALRKSFFLEDFNFWCEDVSPPEETDERGMGMVWGGVFYLTLKVADLIDTVFFVLRKQNSHITFLHVYHHGVMILTGYGGVRFLPGGNGCLLVLVNCIVHTFMYTYYLLSGLDSTRAASVKWKKHITQLQLAQFMILLIHQVNAFLDQTCEFPHGITLLLLMQNFFMVFLFSDFYWRTYIRPKTPKAKTSVVHQQHPNANISYKVK